VQPGILRLHGTEYCFDCIGGLIALKLCASSVEMYGVVIVVLMLNHQFMLIIDGNAIN
jgi:hypothetical protein